MIIWNIFDLQGAEPGNVFIDLVDGKEAFVVENLAGFNILISSKTGLPSNVSKMGMQLLEGVRAEVVDDTLVINVAANPSMEVAKALSTIFAKDEDEVVVVKQFHEGLGLEDSGVFYALWMDHSGKRMEDVPPVKLVGLEVMDYCHENGDKCPYEIRITDSTQTITLIRMIEGKFVYPEELAE